MSILASKQYGAIGLNVHSAKHLREAVQFSKNISANFEADETDNENFINKRYFFSRIKQHDIHISAL